MLLTFIIHCVSLHHFMTSFQVAMAGWDRITKILTLQSNLVTINNGTQTSTNAVIEFKNVYFGYDEGQRNIA